VIRSQKEINTMVNQSNDGEKAKKLSEFAEKLYKIYEKLGDSYCDLGLFELGVKNYFKQVNV
jgi:hypothetical protein